jgi:integrase
MARKRNSVPTYQLHSSGRARIRTYDANGERVEIVLPGDYGSDESKQEYERILAQIRGNGGTIFAFQTAKSKNDLTIAELVAAFMAHAKTYYVDPITKMPTSEISALAAAFRPLVRLHARQPAVEFGPLSLQTLRTAMLSGSWMNDEERRAKPGRRIGLARTTCNKNINRIKLLFKWAASNELIPASVHHGLLAVPGLRRGRSGARETAPVKPISMAIVNDTLPHLRPIVRDMVRVLLLTGMRCGEACIMRACDLDVSGEIWIYRPERHKGLWRGKERAIAIGPKAQAIIKPYLGTKLNAYLFSPAAQGEMIQAERRANRKTPLYPSHMKRNADKKKLDGRRRPGDRFKVTGVNKAIGKACRRAKIEHWHTHQLRHSASLAFVRELGLESARAALGHATVDMSAMYAGHDLEAAKNVAKRIG